MVGRPASRVMMTAPMIGRRVSDITVSTFYISHTASNQQQLTNDKHTTLGINSTGLTPALKVSSSKHLAMEMVVDNWTRSDALPTCQAPKQKCGSIDGKFV